MDIQVLVQLIGNVGFPIAISLILLQTILVKFNKQMDGLEKRLAQLDKTMNVFVKAILNNPSSTHPSKEIRKE